MKNKKIPLNELISDLEAKIILLEEELKIWKQRVSSKQDDYDYLLKKIVNFKKENNLLTK